MGREPGHSSLDALASHAIERFGADTTTPVTIVGADSVHSTVREMVGSPEREYHTHQTVARFLVRGDDLPDELNLVTQYQMAKLVSSVIDYRVNSNGYAEVDIFLDSSNVTELARFNVSPKQPVSLSSADIADLSSEELRRMLQHLHRGCRNAKPTSNCRAPSYSSMPNRPRSPFRTPVLGTPRSSSVIRRSHFPSSEACRRWPDWCTRSPLPIWTYS